MNITTDALARIELVREAMAIQKRLKDVDGWLSIDQGYALYTLAGIVRGRGAIVEIGSFKGLSTCWLAMGCGLVYAVDHFQGSPEMQRGGEAEDKVIVETGTTFPIFERNLNMVGLRFRVHPIQKPSLEAAAGWTSGPIALLFIDAGHSYKDARGDFDAWLPHLAPDAMIAIHDVPDPEEPISNAFIGVGILYEELMGGGEYIEVLKVGTMRVIQRRTAA